jgi:hypothetical protein
MDVDQPVMDHSPNANDTGEETANDQPNANDTGEETANDQPNANEPAMENTNANDQPTDSPDDTDIMSSEEPHPCESHLVDDGAINIVSRPLENIELNAEEFDSFYDETLCARSSADNTFFHVVDYKDEIVHSVHTFQTAPDVFAWHTDQYIAVSNENTIKIIDWRHNRVVNYVQDVEAVDIISMKVVNVMGQVYIISALDNGRLDFWNFGCIMDDSSTAPLKVTELCRTFDLTLPTLDVYHENDTVLVVIGSHSGNVVFVFYHVSLETGQRFHTQWCCGVGYRRWRAPCGMQVTVHV